MPTPAEEEADRARQAAELAAHQEAQRQVSASTLRDGMAKDQLQPKPIVQPTQAQRDFEQRQRSDQAMQHRLEAARLNEDPARRGHDWLRRENDALVAEESTRQRQALEQRIAERAAAQASLTPAPAPTTAPPLEQPSVVPAIVEPKSEPQAAPKPAKYAQFRQAQQNYSQQTQPQLHATLAQQSSQEAQTATEHTGLRRYAELRAQSAREDYQPLREQSDYRQRRAGAERREVAREETDARASRTNSSASRKTNERGGMGD